MRDIATAVKRLANDYEERLEAERKKTYPVSGAEFEYLKDNVRLLKDLIQEIERADK